MGDQGLVEKTAMANELNLGLGSQIFIQIQGVPARVKSTLVGAVDGQYLILTVPKMKGADSQIYEGNLVTVTFLSEGVVYGFRTNILNHIFLPARLMFLSYPSRVERHVLRKQQRLECNIPAETCIEGQEEIYRGILLDISTGGCRFTFMAPPTLNALLIQPGTKLDTTFELMGIKNPRTVSGEIRSVSQDDRKVTLGISFDQANIEALNKIESYVNSVIKFL